MAGVNDTRYLGPMAEDQVFSSQEASHWRPQGSERPFLPAQAPGPQAGPQDASYAPRRKEVGMLKVCVALAVVVGSESDLTEVPGLVRAP